MKNNNVLLNLDNCSCCFGHLTRGKVLKNLYNNIHLSLTRELLPEKKEFFPYEYITGDYDIYLNYLKNNKINIVIHDVKININLYNACNQYSKYNKLKQYLIYTNSRNIDNITSFDNIDCILLPYPEIMRQEFNFIKTKKPKIFIDGIYNYLNITNDNIKLIKNKYNICNNKKNIVVTVSTGNWDFSEKIFQRIYDVYKNIDDYNLIFIYGIYYKGKIFKSNNLTSSIFENNMLSLFSLADIVICQGSYNTITECINLNKNIICFPRHDRELNEASRYAKYYNKIKVVNILNDTSK